MKEDWVPLGRDELLARYGAFYDSIQRPVLDESRVPEKLRRLIPYAELWGASDDVEREDLIRRAPDEAKADLALIYRVLADDLEEWLTGDEAKAAKPSREFIAFADLVWAAVSL